MCMFLGGWRKQEYLKKTHTDMGRASKERPQLEPRHSCYDANLQNAAGPSGPRHLSVAWIFLASAVICNSNRPVLCGHVESGWMCCVVCRIYTTASSLLALIFPRIPCPQRGSLLPTHQLDLLPVHHHHRKKEPLRKARNC